LNGFGQVLDLPSLLVAVLECSAEVAEVQQARGKGRQRAANGISPKIERALQIGRVVEGQIAAAIGAAGVIERGQLKWQTAAIEIRSAQNLFPSVHDLHQKAVVAGSYCFLGETVDVLRVGHKTHGTKGGKSRHRGQAHFLRLDMHFIGKGLVGAHFAAAPE